MDQVEWVTPGPRLENIIDLEETIRWDPGDGGWEQVHAADSCCWGEKPLETEQYQIRPKDIPSGNRSATSLD